MGTSAMAQVDRAFKVGVEIEICVKADAAQIDGLIEMTASKCDRLVKLRPGKADGVDKGDVAKVRWARKNGFAKRYFTATAGVVE